MFKIRKIKNIVFVSLALSIIALALSSCQDVTETQTEYNNGDSINQTEYNNGDSINQTEYNNGDRIYLIEYNNGDSINLKINDTVEINLESNPTTGYGWFLSDKTNESIVSLVDSEYIASEKDEKMVGVGGYETFTFKAVSKGETRIILNHERPSEEDTDLLETFEVTISVD